MKEKERKDYVEIDLLAMFKSLLSHWIEIVAVMVIFGCLSAVYTLCLVPNQYESNCTLVVNSRDSQTITDSNITADQIYSALNLIDSYRVILLSDTVMDQVIENLDMTSIDGYEKITAEYMSENIVDVSQVDESQVMQITATTGNAQLSQDICNEILGIAPSIITQTVKAGSVETISEPKLNNKKVSPSLSKNVLIAALIGFILICGYYVVRSLTDRTFKTSDDIAETLELPVIGLIPKYEE